ncbi:MAG TPA: serine hydrolase domain-containing protein [Gemmatimonadales bacterium]|nr:serine hydrolase domain-containing protein [Gemmatimonadales bacterium]
MPAFAPLALAAALAAPRSQACDPALAYRLTQTITPMLTEHAAHNSFSGVVLVACDGKPVYSIALGYADRAHHVPNTLQTRFNLGSMNKMWTAVAIAQLVEQGKVDLDAPVGRYLPDFPNPDVRANVLVRHLLTHTSGMDSYFTRGYIRNHVRIEAASELARYYAEDSLLFRPGTRFHYSNAGFATLGMIVERVSGMNYFDYVRKNVLARAGMTGAAFMTAPRPGPEYAIGYAKPPGATEELENSDFIEGSSPAGGAYADAASLVAFSRALWSGRLVGLATVSQFTTGKVEMGPGLKYAYGFGEGSNNGWRTVGHNGGGPGIGAEFLSFPEHGIDAVVLTNLDPPEVSRVIAGVAAVVTGGNAPGAAAGGPGDPAGGGEPPALDRGRLPDVPVGRRAAAFLDAFSAGGPAYERFIADQMVPTDQSPADRAKAGVAMRERVGALKFKSLLAILPTQVIMVVESERAGDLKVSLQVEPAPPNRVLPRIDVNPYP